MNVYEGRYWLFDRNEKAHDLVKLVTSSCSLSKTNDLTTGQATSVELVAWLGGPV